MRTSVAKREVGGVGTHTWSSTGFSVRWVRRLVAGKVQRNRVSVTRLITVI